MSTKTSPSRALLLAPLLPSTVTLTYALSEVFTFLPFLHSPASVADNAVIDHYWKSFVYYGGGTVVVCVDASTIMGAMLWKRLSYRSLIGKLAGCGAMAAAGHFLSGRR